MNEMKRADVLLLVVLVLLAGFFILRNVMSSQETAQIIEIRQGNEEPTYVSLHEDAIIDLSRDGKINVIQVKDGSVHMIEANCRDHLCVKKGHITKVGDSIVCLPHRLAISILGEEEGEIDVLSQ